MSRILETLIWEPNVEMQYELVLMLLLFLLPAAFAKRKKTVGICWGLAFAGFLFLHRALLAFLVSGLYLGFLAGVICFIWQPSLAAFTRPVSGRTAQETAAVSCGGDPFGASDPALPDQHRLRL